MSAESAYAPRPLTGIALALCGWAAFSAQDAIVKWLVVWLPVSEVLFARSVIIVALSEPCWCGAADLQIECDGAI